MNHRRRKQLGLILTTADRREGDLLAAEILEHGGSRERWGRAARTPALHAHVHTIVSGNRSTPTEMLEQACLHTDSYLSNREWFDSRGYAKTDDELTAWPHEWVVKAKGWGNACELVQ